MSDPYRGRCTRDHVKPQDERWYLNDTKSHYAINERDLSWRIFQEENSEFFEGGALSQWLGEPRRIFHELIRRRWSIILDTVEARALDTVIANRSAMSRANLFRTLVDNGITSVPIAYEKVGNILQMGLIRSTS